MSNALVTTTDDVQATDMLAWLNGSPGLSVLDEMFLVEYTLAECVAISDDMTMQDYVDDLAMWCGQPM